MDLKGTCRIHSVSHHVSVQQVVKYSKEQLLSEKRWLAQSRGKSRDSLNDLSLFFCVRLSFLSLFLVSFSHRLSLIGRSPTSVVVDNVNFVLFQQSNLVITKKISYTSLATVFFYISVFMSVCKIHEYRVKCVSSYYKFQCPQNSKKIVILVCPL